MTRIIIESTNGKLFLETIDSQAEQDYIDRQTNPNINFISGRVKINGINPDGSKFPVRQFGEPWIDPNHDNTPEYFNSQIYPLQSKGIKFEIAEIERSNDSPIIDNDIPNGNDFRVTPDMVDLSLGLFNHDNERIHGEFIAIANQTFPPELYNIPIRAITQLRLSNGTVENIKENELFFTETERDERIQINESYHGETKAEVFVWYDNTPIGQSKEIEIIHESEETPTPTPPPTPQKDTDFLTKVTVGSILSLIGLSIFGGKS